MNITVTPYEGRNVFVLDNVLTKDECNQLIEQSINTGYSQVAPTGGKQRSWCDVEATEVRKNEKVSYTDAVTANLIWKRIQQHLPKNLEFRAQELGLVGDYLDSKLQGKEWSTSGVCDHLRFVKYHRRDQFLKHMDGTYSRMVVSQPQKSDNIQVYKEQSFLSIVVYLNDSFEGGDTVFFDNNTKKEKFAVKPRTGSVLVMLHENLHEGACVTKGEKFILRSDILFRKKVEQQNAAEAFKEVADAQKKLVKLSKQGVREVPTEWQKFYHPSCKLYTD
jgi:prolyl 4-hydroxylase